MNFIAILAALGLEQWRAFEWRASVERAFVRYVRTIERKFNGGTQQHGVLAAIAAIAPPVVGAAVLFWLGDGLHWALGLVINVVAL